MNAVAIVQDPGQGPRVETFTVGQSLKPLQGWVGGEQLSVRTADRLSSARRSGDAAALLRARLRAGLVSVERVAYAAALGHQVALAVVPEPAPRPESSYHACRLAGADMIGAGL